MKDYLAQLDATADSEKFTLVQQWIANEPLPFFKVLREQLPILVTPKATLVTRLDDCVEVLNQPRVFTVALYDPKMSEFLMSHDDDAFHTREKSIMQGFLNRDDLPQVRNMVANIAKQLIAEANGSMEAINGYCRMVPATLVQDYFGLTGADRKDLIEWSYWNQADTFYNQPFDQNTDAERQHIIDEHARTSKELGKYILELMARRLLAVKAEQAQHAVLILWYGLKKLIRLLSGKKNDKLTDDIVTRMLRTSYSEATDFDLKRVGVNAGGLLIGSIETTSQAVGQVIEYLLNHPEWKEKAQAAAAKEDSTEFDAIVWEALRFVPISSYLFRQVAQDTVIARGTAHETHVKKDDYVLIVTQSAMFDKRAFNNPDTFDPGRNWYHQFHFGYGSHECLGRYVGAVMIPEMVRQILLRPDIKQNGSIDYEGGHLPQRYELTW